MLQAGFGPQCVERREDARALRKLRQNGKGLRSISYGVLWSAMRLRIPLIASMSPR